MARLAHTNNSNAGASNTLARLILAALCSLAPLHIASAQSNGEEEVSYYFNGLSFFGAGWSSNALRQNYEVSSPTALVHASADLGLNLQEDIAFLRIGAGYEDISDTEAKGGASGLAAIFTSFMLTGERDAANHSMIDIAAGWNVRPESSTDLGGLLQERPDRNSYDFDVDFTTSFDSNVLVLHGGYGFDRFTAYTLRSGPVINNRERDRDVIDGAIKYTHWLGDNKDLAIIGDVGYQAIRYDKETSEIRNAHSFHGGVGVNVALPQNNLDVELVLGLERISPKKGRNHSALYAAGNLGWEVPGIVTVKADLSTEYQAADDEFYSGYVTHNLGLTSVFPIGRSFEVASSALLVFRDYIKLVDAAAARKDAGVELALAGSYKLGFDDRAKVTGEISYFNMDSDLRSVRYSGFDVRLGASWAFSNQL